MNTAFDETFRLGEQLDRSDAYSLYRGTQILANDVTRDVSILLASHWNFQDEEARNRHLAECKLLMELGQTHATPTVFDFGLADERGAWVAQEPVVATLESYIKAQPADPDLVRDVMRQVLLAQETLNDREPPILYTNLSPRNILLLPKDRWVLNGSGIEIEGMTRRTLEERESKYNAPEILDPERGDATQASSLYSLGMALYELALGKAKFMTQFPSVYGDTPGDSRGGDTVYEKWLYWHVSPQLTLTPLKELLPGFPADMSDAIERMLQRAPEERPESARVLLDKIAGSASPNVVRYASETEGKEPLLTPMAKVLLAIIIASVLVGGGVLLFSGAGESLRSSLFPSPASIRLVESEVTTAGEYAKVSGMVTHMPPDAKVVVAVKHDLLIDRATATVDSQSGLFNAQVHLAAIGEYMGACSIVAEDDGVLAQAVYKVVRTPPESVDVTFVTQPPAFAAIVSVSCGEDEGDAGASHKTRMERRNGITDLSGQAVVDIPYGAYTVTIDHPRYELCTKALSTGSQPRSQENVALKPLSERLLLKKIKSCLLNYAELASRVSDDDVHDIMAMAHLQQVVTQLFPPSSSAEPPKQKARYTTKLKLVEQLASYSGVDNQNESQAGKLKTLAEKLNVLNLADFHDWLAAWQRSNVGEMPFRLTHAQSVALGLLPPDSKETLGEDAYQEKAVAKQIGDIERQLQSLAKSAMAGDPEALRQASELEKKKQVLQAILPTVPSKENQARPHEPASEDWSSESIEAINQEIDQASARVAAGDLTAQARLALLQRKRAILQAVEDERLTLAEARPLLRFSQAYAAEGSKDLVFIPSSALRSYLRMVLPQRAFTVTEDPLSRQLAVNGCVLDEESREILRNKLRFVEKRLALDIRIDPNVIVDGLRGDLETIGIDGALVHPLLAGPSHRLYVSLPHDISAEKWKEAKLLTAAYIPEPTLAMVCRAPKRSTNTQDAQP